jgi:anti-sigma factor RsiW
MNEHQEVEALLLLYVTGRLDPAQRAKVEKHLAGCQACRADLDLWRRVGAEIETADRRVTPPAGLAERALARIPAQTAKSKPGRADSIKRAWQILVTQAPLLRREIWMVSALVLVLGYIASVILQNVAGFQALAPLIAAAGIAVIYGPENDPNLEMALATTTSPRQILLARLALVFGYNLLLSLAVSLALLPFVPGLALGQLILTWLAPMTFLSGCALFLSLWIGPDMAITLTYLTWLARIVQAASNREPVIRIPDFVQASSGAFARFWENPQALLGLGLLICAAAVFSADLANRRLLRHG